MPASSPPTNAPKTTSALSAAIRASVADRGRFASSSALEVNASGCSASPRRRSARYAAASAGARRRITSSPCALGSNDFKVTLHLPVGDGVLPLPPFPFASGGEVIDELVAEPVPRD